MGSFFDFFSFFVSSYTMRRTQVGPGTNNYRPKNDIGKNQPAANTDGYRMTNTAAGPAASGTTNVATQDAGKTLPAANTDGYRMVGTAAGPAASGTTYVATQDIGKYQPAADSPY